MKGELKKLIEQLDDSDSKIAFHKNTKNSRLKRVAELVGEMSEKEKQDFVKKNPELAAALLVLKTKEKGVFFLGESKKELKEVAELFGQKVEETLEEGKTFTSDMIEKGKKKILYLLTKLF